MAINFSDATPAAPSGSLNVKWQKDLTGNVSAYLTGAAGTVTSIALSMPAEFMVAGSPITGSGTFGVTKANQAQNSVYCGPTTGGSGAPVFRALVAEDIPAGVGAVSSVFGRTGAVVALAGDYTAAKVTNAVSTILTYADPAWITSLDWAKLTGVPLTFPSAPHTHDAADIVSGILLPARLGSGSASILTYLRGDGTWATASSSVTSVFGRSGAVVAVAGDYTVGQVTGAVPTSLTISSGTGLSGGGDLSANRTLSLIPASSSIIGGVKTGANITIDADGTINAGVPEVETVGVTIDGGGSTPATGHKGYIQIPYAGTIVGWAVVADVAGSMTMEIGKKASSAPPAVPSEPNTTTDKISASAPVTLSGATSASAGISGVSTWATAVNQWDVIGFNLTAAATVQRFTVSIYVMKTGAGSGTVSAIQTPWLSDINGANHQLFNVSKIGIGTSAPAHQLTIISPNVTTLAYQSNQMAIGEQSNNADFRLTLGYINLAGVWMGSIQAVQGGAPGSVLVLQPQGGDVGIGTTAPFRPLHVVRSDGVASVLVETGAAQYDAAQIELKGGKANVHWQIITNREDVGGTPDALIFYKNLGTSGAKMVIQDNGHVGIGTVTPAYPLDVTGDIHTTGDVNCNTVTCGYGITSKYYTMPAAGNMNFYGNWLLYDAGSGGTQLTLRDLVNGRAAIVVAPGAAGASWVNFDGKVGINIAGAVPAYALHVGTDSAAKPATSTWTVASDRRLKRDVKPLAGGLERILLLRPVEAQYNGLDGTPDGLRIASFVAQEVEPVLPYAVSSHGGTLLDADGKAAPTDILDLNMHEIIMHLVLAVQELAGVKPADGNWMKFAP